MSKRKGKTQKKKFFSHPKNKNKVFVKKTPSESSEAAKAGAVLRKRGNYSVLSTEAFQEVPHCSHGPCLLFGSRTDGKVVNRFFACAVYRSDLESCPYKAEVNESNEIVKIEGVPKKVDQKKKQRKEEAYDWQYACIPKKLKQIEKGKTLVFCRTCTDVFEEKHNCPSEVVRRKELKTPSRYLTCLDNQSGEAQFFFSDDSLAVICATIDRSNVDGVLCIGAPRIFETLRNEKKDGRKLYMLDYDKRYAHFYPSTQYGQYSMLVDHFFDARTEKKLKMFMAECSSLLVICDPPFGVYTDPLMKSLEKMKTRHVEAREGSDASFFFMVVIPLFVGKHVLKLDKEYWMNDYRVTYENHRVFSKPSKTTVRIFSNLKPQCFDLSNVEGYVFCEMCEQHVSERNKHCFMCGFCTSKDGSPQRHCEMCMRCVKTSYRHCRLCSRCHLDGRCPTKAKLGAQSTEYRGQDEKVEEDMDEDE